MVRKDCTEKLTSEQSAEFGEEQSTVLDENIPRRGSCKGKAPGTGAHLVCLRNGRSGTREEEMETGQREEAGRANNEALPSCREDFTF